MWLCDEDLIHFVFAISSRATGRTGTSGCWNAILTHPRQLRPLGMNWSTSSSNWGTSLMSNLGEAH